MSNLWSNIVNFPRRMWLGFTQLLRLRKDQIPHILDNFSKREIYTVIVLILIFLLSGGFLIIQAFTDRTPGPRYGGEVTEGLVGQPQFINPILALTNAVDTDLSRIIFAQLLKYDENQNLTPDLAASLPEISTDHKTYTLKLKPNLKWQDGKPLNADDVVFTIQTIQNADFESPLRPNWIRVKLDKIDDQTIKFTLREVSASFLNNFAIGIIPKHVWEGLSPRNFRLSDNNLKPVGSGPFVIREIKKTSDGTVKQITLRENNHYHAGRPLLDRVTFKFYDNYDLLVSAYQGKEISSLGFIASDKKTFISPSDKYKQYEISLPQYQAVFFNLAKNPILSEKAVRQALWLSTDRTPIVTDVYSNQADPVYGPILPESFGYNPEIANATHHDLAEASQILDKAGWILLPGNDIRTKKGKTLEFNLATNGNLVLNVKTAQALESQWANVGAKINLIIVGPTELEQDYIRPRDFDALLFAENTGADPDPFPFWHSSQVHDPGLNLAGFTNTEADKLMTEARQTIDISVRTRNYLRFQQIINSELPAIFLAQSQYVYHVPKKIQNLNLAHMIQPSERFQTIERWYLEK